MKITKRSGEKVEYDGSKIVKAVAAAMMDTNGKIDKEICHRVEQEVLKTLKAGNYPMTVEGIQNSVENTLMSIGDCNEVAKNYILYRDKRTQERNKEWEMNELQRDVFNNKYRFEGESFNEFIKRVSGGNEDIAKLVRNKDFLFGGRILAGRGIDRNVSLANCTTLPPVEDSIEGIFGTAGELARMFSYGQGAGIDISNLRPKGSPVNNASKTSTGAVSFMNIFDTVGEVIGAEGRRSALLIAMDANHDDILDFTKIKDDVNKVTNANISVMMDDEFMKLDTPHKNNVLKEIATGSWRTGEPAILYWDNNKKWHLLSEDEDYVIEGVNACSEYPTTGYGTCLLGSINLSNYVLNPFTDKAKVNIDKLKKDVYNVTIGMNEVLDEAIPTHPLQQQRDVAHNYRQLGIGIMGLADMFIKMGLKYGSNESISEMNQVMTIIRNSAFKSSIDLAKKDGAFPKFDADKVSKSPYFQSLPRDIRSDMLKYGVRNSSLLSIAPAGSISLLADCSNGLEPYFAISYTRTTKSLGSIERDYKMYAKVVRELMEHKGIIKDEDLPEYCITAHDVDPLEKIKLQGSLQHYVDLAISSTVNLKEETTVEEIEDIYKLAHREGLKGISVFRDNCFRIGILNTENEEVEVDVSCPECGGEMIHTGGCEECVDCAYSPCSI